MTTDTITGLPTLPEGDWWEVRRREISTFSYASYGYHSQYKGYEIVWFTPNVKKTETVYDRKHWYSFFKSYHEVYSEEPIVVGRETILNNDRIKETITPKGTKDAAKRLMKRLDDNRITRSLVGKYPPNKI